MQAQFIPVISVNNLDQWIERSQDVPVLLFKHDPHCSISAAAHREMSSISGEACLIDVHQAKDVAREVEQRTGIKHESPQVVMLRNGQAVWSASHYDITSDAVVTAARQHA